MAERVCTPGDLEMLKQCDTPTICNGLELMSPERRSLGFTVEPMVAADRKLRRSSGSRAPGLSAPRRHRADRSRRGRIGTPTSRHRVPHHRRPAGHRRPTRLRRLLGGSAEQRAQGTGVLGCVTNGSFRDLDMRAPGFQMLGGRVGPSHAYVHMVQMQCQVNVFGMPVGHDDVIHADYHGAVVVPADAVRKLPAAIDLIARREADHRHGPHARLQRREDGRGAEEVRRQDATGKSRGAAPLRPWSASRPKPARGGGVSRAHVR